MTPIKCVALLLMLLALTAGVGIAGCKLMGVDPHLHDSLLALPIAFVAAVLAMLPAMLQKNRLDTAGMFQASFIGSVLHLGLILVMALLVLLAKRATTPFVLWLLGAYWATLIGLCVTFASLIRTAPKATKPGH